MRNMGYVREPEETYHGSRIQGVKKHRIPDPQHYVLLNCVDEFNMFWHVVVRMLVVVGVVAAIVSIMWIN